MKYFNLKIIILLLAFTLAQFGCKNKGEKTTAKTENLNAEGEQDKDTLTIDCQYDKFGDPDSSDSSSQVLIEGKIDDTIALRYFNIFRFLGLGHGFSGYPEDIDTAGDSLFFTMEKVNRPQFVELIAFSEKEGIPGYISRLLITPEDSITLDIKQGKMRFKGKNAANYNFFIEMGWPEKVQEPIFKQDPFQYKKELQQSFRDKISFLDEYAKRNPDLTEDSKKMIKEELRYEYWYNLILPRNVRNPDNGLYTNSQRDILFEFIKANPGHESLLDLNEYYEDITLDDFKKPEYINNDFFRRALIQYIRHYFMDNDFMDFSRTNFKKEKQFIQDNFSGELETYAISRLINDYFENGFGHGQEDISLLKDLIREYKDRFTDPTYCERMNEILSNVNYYDYEIPDYALEEELLTFERDTVTFKEVLNQRTKPVKVIDAWASWCAPCIMGIKESQTYRDNLKQNDQADFIYISIDEDQEQWENRVNQLENYFSKADQYLILTKWQDSRLLQALNIVAIPKKGRYISIPRYNLLNYENTIMSNNAPSPTDSISFNRIIQHILN